MTFCYGTLSRQYNILLPLPKLQMLWKKKKKKLTLNYFFRATIM